MDASTAHQIFGRAGRPQFDTRGYVFVLAHEDDVKILRWKQKYDSIPENTKDPGLLKAKEFKCLFLPFLFPLFPFSPERKSFSSVVAH